MTITIKVKNIYGQDLVYPVNHTGELITHLTNRKTLSTQDIIVLKELGFTFEQEKVEL